MPEVVFSGPYPTEVRAETVKSYVEKGLSEVTV